MKFRPRETTDYLYIHLKDTGGLTVKELHREARRAGMLSIDYHYVVQRNGDVETGREPYVIAGHRCENAETSIYILVDQGEKGKLTDSQKVSLQELLESLKGEYPGVEVIKN